MAEQQEHVGTRAGRVAGELLIKAFLQQEENTAHFEPVIKLTEQVQTKTHEEDEDILAKYRAKLFRFEASSSEWKERGTGEVRLLQHRETKKIRLLMRRDKTLKICANHQITGDMKLQPNVGSDRSWVWKVAADFSENTPTAETLAIRFANSDIANEYKTAFEAAQETVKSLPPANQAADDAPADAAPADAAPAAEPEPAKDEPATVPDPEPVVPPTEPAEVAEAVEAVSAAVATEDKADEKEPEKPAETKEESSDKKD